MGSYLIVGIPRTGTTILNSLLKEQINGWNLGEHWKIQDSDINLGDLKENLPLLEHEQKIRLNYLKENANKNWILKIWPEHFLLQKNTLDDVLKSNVTIVMTYRKNVEEHFISWLNSYYRSEKFKLKSYHYTNKNDAHIYDTIDVSRNELVSFYEYFKNSMIYWRMVYELYKDRVILLSYEDEIKPFNLQKVGITKKTVDRYFEKEIHLVPTPYNCNNVSEKEIYSVCLNLITKHKYLVEV